MSAFNPKEKSRGLSTIELLIVMTLTAIIFGITQMVLVRTIDTWWRVNANQESEQQLYRAQSYLERDLRAAAFELQPGRATLAIEKAPPALETLSGADSDVLWFLSAVDPLSGEFQRDKNGAPFFQRNILFYAVTPDGLSGLGYLGAGRSIGGYEVACPFKMLIRKEIDSGPLTAPDTDVALTSERLMSFDEILPHINRPTGYNCAGMAAANATVRPVAAHVLTFQADLIPDMRGVSIDIRCTAIDRARREGTISDTDLSTSSATTQLQFVVIPPNRPAPPAP